MASPATAAANCDPHEQLDHAAQAPALMLCARAVMAVPIRAHHRIYSNKRRSVHVRAFTPREQGRGVGCSCHLKSWIYFETSLQLLTGVLPSRCRLACALNSGRSVLLTTAWPAAQPR